MKDLSNFQKKKNFLVCVDSDGCVIDGMTVKHVECFGPCLIEEWKLQEYKIEIQNYWNEINLYSLSRGINRFKGLLLALNYISEAGYAAIDSIDLKIWIDTTKELSNKSLIQEITATNSELLRKVLSWSEHVNKKVENLSSDKKQVFPGVVDCFKAISEYADIAVVSSANARAVEEEWRDNNILEYVDVIMTQENGSKAACIRVILAKGYENGKVVMIGDAQGDINSAKENRVLYYPILVDREMDSWKTFQELILKAFLNGTFDAKIMKTWEDEFVQNLRKNRCK